MGEKILKDAFGHVRLDDLNPGLWFATQLKSRLQANKVLVQKSGYFSRSAKPNKKDLDLPTKALYKRLIISLKTAENRVKIDKGAVDRVAKKRKKAAPKPKVAAKPKAKKEEQPTGKTKEG